MPIALPGEKRGQYEGVATGLRAAAYWDRADSD